MTCVLLRLVWKLTVSSPLRDNVPTLWWCTDSSVSVMAWVSVGCGLISTKVACCAEAAVMAWCSNTG